jgi:hypothetical protein
MSDAPTEPTEPEPTEPEQPEQPTEARAAFLAGEMRWRDLVEAEQAVTV